MSIKKFLAATSVVALLAGGSAQALDLTGTTVTLASELDFATAKRGAPVMTVSTNAALPVSNGYRLTVTLTGDLQFRGLTGGAVSGGGIAGSVVSTGGADGSQSVVLLFNTSSTTASFTLAPQIQVVGTNGGTVSILLTDPNGSVIEGGAATLRDATVALGGEEIDLVDYASAFRIAVAADTLDSQLATPTYTAFVANAPDTATTATLADVTIFMDNAVNKSAGNAFVPVVTTDIAGYKIATNFVSKTNFTSVTNPATNGFAAGTVVNTGLVYTGTVTGSPTTATSTGTLSGTVLLTKAAGAVAAQRPTVSLLELNFTPSIGYIAKENGVISSIDVIDLEGQTEGPFKWVGDAAAPTGNVFRVTGITTKIPPIFVTITNSTNNVDGVYQLPTTGKTLSGNAVSGATELILTSADIQNAVGAPYGRANVSFTFGDGSTANTIDVDRLLSASGVVSAYGDDQNDNNTDDIN